MCVSIHLKNQKGFKVAIVLLNQSNLNCNKFTEIKIYLNIFNILKKINLELFVYFYCFSLAYEKDQIIKRPVPNNEHV